MQQNILTINAGSSSVKFALFELTDHISEKAAISGQIDGIGTDQVKLVAKDRSGTRIVDQALPAGANHAQGFDHLLRWFTSRDNAGQIVAVGHRIVHGGDRYSQPVVLGSDDLAELAKYSRLAPLHQPHNLKGIEAITAVLPGVPQIACFDTAFHRTQSPIAQMYGLPRKYTEEGAKRYGFHGISYEYIASVLPQYTQKADGRVVVCHLGNGASMTAMVERKCVATTLGFSTLDGLIMGTRCGDIDASIPNFMAANADLSLAEIDQALNKKSGLLGISGVSSDMRDLHKAAGEGNKRAKLAIDVLLHRALKYIGAYAITLGRVDAIVMTGGIGENDLPFRGALVERLSLLGIKLAADKNTQRGAECEISTPDSAIKVLVIPTNEELVIARDTRDIVSKKG